MAQASSNLWPRGKDMGLIAAISDYLNRLQTSTDLNEDQMESVSVAVQCLQSLSPDGDFPQPPFALEDMYQGFAQAQSATSADSQDEKSKDARNETRSAVPEFSHFVNMIKDRGFFKGCEEGSAEYRERYESARQKYNAKFPNNAVEKEATDDEKERANALKAEGNEFLKKKQYADALAKYSEAIELDPSNAVFYSNRAAVYCYLKDFDAAANDARKSTELDPNYAKAHVRLGVAEKERGNWEEAQKAYEAAADLTPPTAHNFTGIMENVQLCRQKVESKTAPASSRNPPVPGGAGARGGPGGMNPNQLNDMLGGLGGMGGLEGIMKNPMFAQMAQNMMQNPDMMNQMMGMMQDPAMADMARNFMGGSGGGPAGGAPAGGNSPGRQQALMRLLQDPDKMKDVLSRLGNDPEMQQMKADPTAAPLLRRLENGDMSVLMELTSKPDILRKLQSLIGKYVDDS